MNPEFKLIPLCDLLPNDYNARKFDDMTTQRKSKFAELINSIKEKGILEPLLVRPMDHNRFQVIAGERRYRASLEIADGQGPDMQHAFNIPCMIHDIEEDAAFDMMVIENLQREDLNPFELATSFQHYLERHGNNSDAVKELSLRTGIPVHAIRRQIRLLELAPEVLKAWKYGSITQSHAELFTRVGDYDQTIELLKICQQMKLSTRELANRIGAAAPDLERGFFDKTDCLSCHYNTTIQSGLFADLTPAGKCSNSLCFEEKQDAFLEENWTKSKPAVQFGTRSFRFGHRIDTENCKMLASHDTADRCLGCDVFVSVLRLTGAVISGYERTCIGPRKCFDELYREQPAEETEQTVTEAPEMETTATDQETKQQETEIKPAEEKTKPGKFTTPDETGPVNNAARALRFREIFYRTQLPSHIKVTQRENAVTRTSILALGLASSAARTSLIAAFGLQNDAPAEEITRLICEVPAGDLDNLHHNAVIAQILSPSVSHNVRHIIAKSYHLDMNEDFTLTDEYLQSLSASEIVRMGEEDGTGLWSLPSIVLYRGEHFSGKALRSLKKQDLIDIILKSETDLTGLVPAEIAIKAEA